MRAPSTAGRCQRAFGLLGWALLLCAVTEGPYAWAQTGTLGHNPVEVVKKFVELDGKGARLDPTTFGAVTPFIGWGGDPSWGHVVVVSRSTVDEDFTHWDVRNTLEVLIPVTFSVLGSVYYETGTFIPEPGEELVHVRVKAVKNRWRIVEPMLPPHVGQKRMLNQVRQAWLDESDPEKRASLASLQDAIRQAK